MAKRAIWPVGVDPDFNIDEADEVIVTKNYDRLAVGFGKRYGLTDDEYRSKRVGRCEICGVFSRKRNADHDHSMPGTLRGWLCRGCNVGLGFFQEDPETLYNAMFYILMKGGKNVCPTL